MRRSTKPHAGFWSCIFLCVTLPSKYSMARFGKRKAVDEKDKRKIDKAGFRKLLGVFRYMLAYKIPFGVGMFALLFSSTVLLAFPNYTGELVDLAMGKGGSPFAQNVNQVGLLLFGILAVQSVFSFLRVYFFAQVSERAMRDIRLDLFERYMRLPMSFYDRHRTGELLSRASSDVTQLQDTFNVTLAEFFRQVITLVVGLSVLFLKTPKLTFFMLGVVPLLVLVALVFGRYIRKLSKATQDEQANSNIVVEEALQAISTVKAFANEAFELGRYRSRQDKVVNVALRAATFRGAFISFIIFVLIGSIVAVLWYGASLVESGEITIGDLTAFILYTMFIAGSLSGLGDIYGQIQKAVGASERILEILEEPEEKQVKESQDTDFQCKGEVRFSNVQFAYPTRPEVQVLQGMDFTVRPGESVALVGHSGAGKSTLVQLLLRFYQPQGGEITVDGRDVSTLNLKNYRQAFGMVPQEVLLFGGTIRENIAYAKPEASEEEIREAARRAYALEFIENFPDGFETTVGERGVKLSGGQRQRIAIARAILKNPRILILDEATSALDADSERYVKAALDELMKGRTTIVIAHRLGTIRQVDRIFVLEQGQLREEGSHEELLQRKGAYEKLVSLQMADG